jgi:uncharacterized integral membrane protein
MHPTFLVVISIVVAAVVFAAQNTDITEIEFLFWQWHGSLALVLLFSFLLGIVAGVIGVYSSQLQRYLERRNGGRGGKQKDKTEASHENDTHADGAQHTTEQTSTHSQ